MLIASIAFAVGLGAGWLVTRPSSGDGAPLVAEDVRDHIVDAMADEGLVERITKIVELLPRIDDANASGIGEGLEAVLTPADEFSIKLLISAWARIDANAALDEILGWPASKKKHAVGPLMLEWGMINPVEAKEALAVFEDNEMLDVAISNLVYGWARAGHDGVERFVARRLEGSVQRRMTAMLATRQLKAGGPEAAFAWADALLAEDDSDYRSILIERTTTRVAQVAPAEAAAWLSSKGEEGHIRIAITSVARHWIASDPDATREWLRSIDDEVFAEHALRTAFVEWARDDPTSATGWALEVGAPALPDRTDALVLSLLVKDDPASALDYAGTMRDPARARRARIIALRAWRAASPEDATAWMDAHDTPDEIRAASVPAPDDGIAGRRRPARRTGGVVGPP